MIPPSSQLTATGPRGRKTSPTFAPGPGKPNLGSIASLPCRSVSLRFSFVRTFSSNHMTVRNIALLYLRFNRHHPTDGLRRRLFCQFSLHSGLAVEGHVQQHFQQIVDRPGRFGQLVLDLCFLWMLTDWHRSYERIPHPDVRLRPVPVSQHHALRQHLLDRGFVNGTVFRGEQANW